VSIEIANESGTSVQEAALAALARHVLDDLHVHPLAELSVLIVDPEAMADLHQRWLNEPGPTDVLAFPMDELRLPPPGGSAAEHADAAGPALLGDVVLCPQVAAEQAAKAGHSVADELDLLCTHGILHLLGYDHADPQEHAAMFGLQDKLLASWRSARDGATAQAAGGTGGVAGPGRAGGTGGAAGPGAADGAGGPGAADGAGGLGGAGGSGGAGGQGGAGGSGGVGGTGGVGGNER
jgi:probable rRNA maturation factor